MAGKFLNSYLLFSCHQNATRISVLGMKICSSYAQCFATTTSSRDAKKLKPEEPSSADVMQGQRFQLPEIFNKLLKEIPDMKRIDFDEIDKVGSSKKVADGDFHKVRPFQTKDITEEDVYEIDQLKRKGQAQAFNHSLASYISVCIYSGLYDSAYETFNYFRNIKPVNSEGLNLLPFNEILKGIAYQGDLKKMKEVLISIEESFLEVDFNTIAYCLTCLGRNENTPGIAEDIQSIFKLMVDHKITIEKVFSNANFPGDSLHYCLRAVEKVIPNIKEILESFNPTEEFVWKENSHKHQLLSGLNTSKFTKQVRSPFEEVISQDKLQEMIQRQVDAESKGYISVQSIDKPVTVNSEDAKLWEKWNIEWRKSLHKRLKEYKAFMMSNVSDSNSCHLSYLPYLNVLSNEEVVDIMMTEICGSLCTNLTTKQFNEMVLYLGEKFYNHFLIRYKEKNHPYIRNVYEKYCNSSLNYSDSDSSMTPRAHWNKILAEEIHTMNSRDCPVEWPYTVQVSIGQMLCKFIFDCVKVWSHGESPENGSPAFKTNLHFKSMVKPSVLLLQIRKSCGVPLLVRTGKLPMLSPPLPFTSLNNGGYILNQTSLLRMLKHQIKQIRRIKEDGIEKIYPLIDSLNTLAAEPWKINCEILDIIIEVFRNGGSAELCICPPPESLPPFPEITKSMSEQQKFEASKYRYQLRKLFELYNETRKRLNVLNHYRDFVIWFPYQADCRGRMYPVCEFVTHVQYNDLFRSTLHFAKGKKLGKEGLNWLKIHLVNLTGMVKTKSIEDRLKFCEEVMDEIVDSAKNPLDGKKWWLRSDAPWQTLAACKELVSALESECPEEYVSHLPIHQDGSCNVFQHFTALAREKMGAKLVNLCPSEKPYDVYTHIAEKVENKRVEDAESGITVARCLEGFINRKVIKQAVMASIYGGSGRSLKRAILKIQHELNYFPKELKEESLTYLESSISDNLASLFPTSVLIKRWFKKLATGISEQCLQAVEFKTPLGLPIVINYGSEFVFFRRQAEVISSYDTDFSQIPDHGKQRRGFGPNFIQSLEASHMMLTSLFCKQAGISFVSIHDCFWTHSATVPIMNKICREQFVKLYSQPILEDLAKFMIDEYSSCKNYKLCYTSVIKGDETPASLDDLLKNVPQRGDFDINEVLNSTFFFS